MPQANAILQCTNLTKRFGGLAAVKDLTFTLYEGETAGLIGPNGAGKTTAFNLLTGVTKPDSGSVIFKNRELTKLPAHKIAHLGLARTFQLIKNFSDMNVTDNVMLGGIFGRGKGHALAFDDAVRYLDMVGLSNYDDMTVRGLTPYDRKRVELAATLNTEPKLLLLDEFVAGLNDSELGSALAMTKRIGEELGITLFWIEHVMKVIMSVADRIIVMDRGEKIAEGPPREIARDPKVIAAYLGSEYVQESEKGA